MKVATPRRGYMLLSAVLLAVMTAVAMMPTAAQEVYARRYGGRNYGQIYAKYIARCKGRCGRTNAAMRACINRDRKTEGANCRQEPYSADRALCTDRTCAKDVKSRLKFCLGNAGVTARNERKQVRVGACNTCCQRTKGSGSCTSYFSGSRFYGSSRYRGRLNCYSDGSGGSGGSCTRTCELTARRGFAACGKGKRGGDPECTTRVQAELAACLAACQGSPSGAFTGRRLSDAIRARVASWLPAALQAAGD